MSDQRKFLWLSTNAPPSGFREVPKGGMCVSAFLFVTRGDDLLLGKYADDPAWEQLAGLDPDRVKTHGKGWTIPASQLRFGEQPRDAGERIAKDILHLQGVHLHEFPPESDLYRPVRFPELGLHYDIWCFYEASISRGSKLEQLPWYDALEFHDARSLPESEYARGHRDVVERWLTARNKK